MPPETVTIVIRSEPGQSIPFPIRLRRCLKLMLRAFGLRVVSISQAAARGLP